jgi:hypothetical protein
VVNKINSMKSGDGGIKDRVLEIAAQCASRIDNPDQLWDYMTSKVCDVVKNHPNVLPERINNLILNNLKKVKYGTTYCLTQEDKYATFDFQEASEAASNEAAKWVLEPFDPAAEGYSTTAYYPYLDVTPEQHYSSSTLDGATVDDGWNYTTGYYDFDAAVADPANGTTEAYKALEHRARDPQYRQRQDPGVLPREARECHAGQRDTRANSCGAAHPEGQHPACAPGHTRKLRLQ